MQRRLADMGQRYSGTAREYAQLYALYKKAQMQQGALTAEKVAHWDRVGSLGWRKDQLKTPLLRLHYDAYDPLDARRHAATLEQLQRLKQQCAHLELEAHQKLRSGDEAKRAAPAQQGDDDDDGSVLVRS